MLAQKLVDAFEEDMSIRMAHCFALFIFASFSNLFVFLSKNLSLLWFLRMSGSLDQF
jgi:hypothetical protein